MECPECGHDEYMSKNGSDVWFCENCGWDEQEEIDRMNEEGEFDDLDDDDDEDNE